MKIKKVIRYTVFFIVLSSVLGGGYMLYTHLMAGLLPEGSVCDPQHKKYEKRFCQNVAKVAFVRTASGDVKVGTVIGVAWRARGDVIGGIGKESKRSDRHRYFYMIDKGEKRIVHERVESIKLK
jgi:hypothetical protein